MIKDLDIFNISLMLSLGCNLSCEYCRIAQSVNSSSKKLQEENIQALKDGTYLNNVKEVLKKLSSPRSKIKCIDFWGQEPTLTLNYLTDNLEDWLKAFPNWNKTMFSTNGMAFGNKIVDFIFKLDNSIDHPFTLDI